MRQRTKYLDSIYSRMLTEVSLVELLQSTHDWSRWRSLVVDVTRDIRLWWWWWWWRSWWFSMFFVYLCVNSFWTSISGGSRLAVWRANPCPFPSFLFPSRPFLSPFIALHCKLTIDSGKCIFSIFWGTETCLAVTILCGQNVNGNWKRTYIFNCDFAELLQFGRGTTPSS